MGGPYITILRVYNRVECFNFETAFNLNLSAGQAEIATKYTAQLNFASVAGRDVTIQDINIKERANSAGIWAVMFDRLVRISKNTMNLTIKYPRFNKKIEKSQVVT